MIETIERGHVVEVEILKKINPSQIFTNFFDRYKGRISIFDLDWSIPLALKRFTEIQEKDKIQCVVLHIDHKNKIVELAVKYIVENVSKEIGWDRISIGNEYQAKVLERLNHYALLKISNNFYGIIDKNSVNPQAENIRVKISEKDSYNNLLYVIGADEDVDFSKAEENKDDEKFNFIDEDCQSFSAFKKSLLGEAATDEEIIEIKKGFKLDKRIFSKNFKKGKTIYLEFNANNDTFNTDFINKAVPFYAEEISDPEEKQKTALQALSNEKYWFKTNTFSRDNEERNQFTFFNDDINIHGEIINEVDSDNVRFEIRKLTVQNTDVNTAKSKKRMAAEGAFLFADEIKVLPPHSGIPIDYSQKDIAELALQKTKCFEIREKLELEKGVLLEKEAKTLEINDHFLEYQIDRLRNEKRESIIINKVEQIPSDEEGLALKLPFEIGDNFDLENGAMVSVKIEDARSFRGFLKAEKEYCVLKFKEMLNLNILRKGFEIEPSISTSQFDVQRLIIHDFLSGNIDIQHFEKVLVKKNNIVTPTLKTINFINPDLQKTQIENSENGQIKAVRKAVGNQNIFLIQGPPGTGKTTVITEIIEQLVSNGEKILVSGQNHVAVDNVLGKLANNPKLNLLRIGNEEKIDEKLIQFNVDKMIEAYQHEYKLFLSNQLKLINKLLELLRNSKSNIPARGIFNLFVDELSKDYQKLREIFRDKHFNLFDGFSTLSENEIKAVKEDFEKWLSNDSETVDLLVKPIVYKDADVVFATCIGIKSDNFIKELGHKFDTVIIDEAGKANITETLVPMELGRKAILVGDQKQLPPYLDSELLDKDDSKSFPNSKFGKKFQIEEIRHATETSFFEFLINRIKEKEFPEENLEMLDFQHRMHPTIGEFISQSFYGGHLKMGHSTANNQLLLDTPFDKEIIFFDTSNVPNSFEQKRDFAVSNEVEATVLLNFIIPELKARNVEAEKMAIIAPYKSQVGLIKKKISELGDPFMARIDVATLDSFQGKEYDIIIFSLTRAADHSNPTIINGKKKFTKVGFLDDARRLNVAFSRAKKKIVLVGNAETLRDKRSHYDFLFDYTSLFETLVKIAKDENKGRFVNIADNYSVKSDFEHFISTYKKDDIVKGKYKSRLDLANGKYLLFFKVDSFDCALASYKIGAGSQVEVDKLENGDFLDLKIEGIDLERNRVFLSTPDYVMQTATRIFTSNNITGLIVGAKFKGRIIQVKDHGYIIRIKEDLMGFLNKRDVKGNTQLNCNDIVFVKIKSINYSNNNVYLKF